MCRNVLVVVMLGLGVLAPQAQAQTKKSVAELIADLKKADPEKLKAIEELESLGEKAGDAVPAMIDLLPAKNEDVRLHVAMAMAKIGKPAVGPLGKALAVHYPSEKIDPAKVADLVKKLASINFAERDKAHKDLETIGFPALEESAQGRQRAGP